MEVLFVVLFVIALVVGLVVVRRAKARSPWRQLDDAPLGPAALDGESVIASVLGQRFEVVGEDDLNPTYQLLWTERRVVFVPVGNSLVGPRPVEVPLGPVAPSLVERLTGDGAARWLPIQDVLGVELCTVGLVPGFELQTARGALRMRLVGDTRGEDVLSAVNAVLSRTGRR